MFYFKIGNEISAINGKNQNSNRQGDDIAADVSGGNKSSYLGGGLASPLERAAAEEAMVSSSPLVNVL